MIDCVAASCSARCIAPHHPAPTHVTEVHSTHCSGAPPRCHCCWLPMRRTFIEDMVWCKASFECDLYSGGSTRVRDVCALNLHGHTWITSSLLTGHATTLPRCSNGPSQRTCRIQGVTSLCRNCGRSSPSVRSTSSGWKVPFSLGCRVEGIVRWRRWTVWLRVQEVCGGGVLWGKGPSIQGQFGSKAAVQAADGPNAFFSGSRMHVPHCT